MKQEKKKAPDSGIILSEAERESQLSLNFNGREWRKAEFSSYIVYADESGDSNLEKIDKGYPAFVLALCIFHKRYYADTLVPVVQSLKFKYFGHDAIVLHEKEIRKKDPPFTFESKRREEEFLEDLSQIMADGKFILIASAIMKDGMPKNIRNAYHAALSDCLENLYRFTIEKGQQKLKTFVIFESRGNKEDFELELEFRRICDGDNTFRCPLPFEIIIKSKQINSTGMQFADLVARPIGRRLIDGNSQKNRAFDILEQKFFCAEPQKLGQNYDGLGLTVNPKKAKGPE